MNKPLDGNLGRYQIVSLIARGGMAEVYKAYQPGLDRYVAIKVLHPHLADEPGFINRFEREAASVARLRHPNIVQVIDFDCQEGRYYMVMEYIEGASLKAELVEREERGEAYTPQEAAYVISGVASALDYAHGRGMVHRDIKPGNILFTGEGQVVLADFGIAHIVGTTLYTESAGALGTPAYLSPEQARGGMGDARSDIYSLGVVLYQMLVGRLPYEADTPLGLLQQHIEAPLPAPREIKPDLAEDAEAVILKALAKQPEERYQSAGEMGEALFAALGLSPQQILRPAVVEVVEAAEEEAKPLPPCPYRGLFAFREEDAPYFYGRELFTERLVEAVEERSLVGVVGPSGSGKSSVVFAGLLPHLRQGAGLREAQGRAWAIAVCRPGATPFYSLATALVPRLEGEVSDTARLVGTQDMAVALRKGQTHLKQLCADILDKNPQYGRLLLVVDQFEELFTMCMDLEERRSFMDTLLEGIEIGSPLTLVLTIRADFLGQVLSYRPFTDALQDTDIKLGPMTRGELSQAVENPARKLGVGFEAGLVERILDDVGDEPGKLPLLEFALTQLWVEQKVGMLSHRAYEAIGGVEGALARYADQVYSELEESQRMHARRAFTQMVMPGEGTEDTRRLAKREELGEEDWALVQELADARLVVTDLNLVSGQETVEVVHEALIQGWGQLQEWMREDRAFRTWQERLRAAMRGWEASERDEGALLRGGPLVEAETWMEERGDELSEAEVSYIQESLDLRQRQQAESERRRRYTIISLAAGLVVAIALAAFALFQRQEAFGQRQNSMRQAAVLLAGQAENELANGYHDRAVLLAMAALENYPYTPQAEHALGRAVSYSRALQIYSGHTSAVTSVTWSPDGRRVASSSSTENRVDIWDPVTGELIRSIDMPTGITGNIFDMALHVQWTPNGQYLLTLNGDRYILGSQDYDLLLWDADSGELLSSVEIANQAEPESGELNIALVNYPTGSAAKIAPHSGRLATLGGDNTAIIWDEGWQEPELLLSGHTQDVNSVDWSPDEKMLVTASLDGTAIVWDTETGQALYTLTGHEGRLNLALWSPDGSSLVTGGEDGTVRIWDAADGALVRTIDTSAGEVSSLVWAPNGVRIVTGHVDGGMRIWEVASSQLLETLEGHQGIISDLKWSLLDDRLASSDGSGVIRIWNAAPSTAWRLYPPQAERGGDWSIFIRDWSSDGRYLATTGGGNEDLNQPRSLAIWDVQANQLIMEDMVDELNYGGAQVRFSPDDQKILYLGANDYPDWSGFATAYSFDVHSGKIIKTFTPGGDNFVARIAWSPDGSQVATGLWNGDIIIWEYQTGMQIAKLVHNTEGYTNNGVEWSPDGSKFASACADSTAKIWDAKTWELLLTLQHEKPAEVVVVSWSPDSTRLLTGVAYTDLGAKDTAARLWDASTGEELLVFNGHAGVVTYGSWSPDGKRIATIGLDGTVRVWDPSTGDELLTLSIPVWFIGYTRWSPDGQHLAISGLHTLVSVWRVWQTKEELIDYARECCVFRDLTDAERQQFGLP